MRLQSCDCPPAYERLRSRNYPVTLSFLSRCWPVPPLGMRVGGWQGAKSRVLVGRRCLR
ncbi:hypothetical protein BDW74DRAFT_154405 [Aspergillus multicolor]|uniref:uncharacterized protein n=1 Tax=Aspergillus multicolor TaxID=41759 RepID=UPI003CCDD5D3